MSKYPGGRRGRERERWERKGEREKESGVGVGLRNYLLYCRCMITIFLCLAETWCCQHPNINLCHRHRRPDITQHNWQVIAGAKQYVLLCHTVKFKLFDTQQSAYLVTNEYLPRKMLHHHQTGLGVPYLLLNRIWWLCLDPTSITRFASDLGYRMAQNFIGLYKENYFHEHRHQILDI